MKRILYTISLLFAVCVATCYAVGAPVILVPGDGGSQFEAKLDKPSVPHSWCSKQSTWFPIWLNLELMVPYVLDCFVDNMRLNYDPKTRTTSNAPGVSLRQRGFGNTSAVEWLDSSQISPTNYFFDIAQALVNQGYKRNVNIRGAPYDFRKAPNEMGDFLQQLEKLIVETYTANGNKKVVLIAHSMGNPYLLYLFNQKPQSWKDKYIKAYVAIAAPFGGAVKIMRLIASGDNLGTIIVNPLTVRAMQRSFPSTMWLMPSDEYWGKDEVLVSTHKRNYTVRDYEAYFKDVGYDTGAEIMKDVRKYTKGLKPPGVEVYCLHGFGSNNTVAGIKYKANQFPDDQPTVVYGDGDGTVNIRSLHGCQNFAKKQKQKVFHKQVEGADHIGILSNHDAISYIKQVVAS